MTNGDEDGKMSETGNLNAGMVSRGTRVGPAKALNPAQGVMRSPYDKIKEQVIAEAREELGYHRSVRLDVHHPDAELEPWQTRRRFG